MTPKRIKPGPGQESVWEYPRPPRVEPSDKHIRVVFNGVVIADTYGACRVLETSHPPTYYIPPQDVRMEYLTLSAHISWCEWKGQAVYYTVSVGNRQTSDAGWAYPRPTAGFELIRDYVTFYPRLMDACTVDGEVVQPQPGGFYGGWITQDVVGPFKGEPGTRGW